MELPEISMHPALGVKEPVFSIIIPSWNNLPYLKLCVDSIRKNSSFTHQIVLHINEGADGSRTWAKDEKLDYSFSMQNAGICLAVNSAFSLCKADYIVYMNDDMYVCPGWDKALYEEIKAVGHERFYLSATMIEPVSGTNPCVIGGHDFGDLERGFDEKRLLAEYDTIAFEDWSGASWPPSVVHRNLWEKVGGFSLEFSPGMYSDPDFSMKLWQAGVRLYKGVSASRVYHFRSKSTGRVKKNNGRKQFYLKWGLPASYFYRNILRMGSAYRGPLPEIRKTPLYFIARLKAIFQKLITTRQPFSSEEQDDI